jgi:hypothetical protein
MAIEFEGIHDRFAGWRTVAGFHQFRMILARPAFSGA